MIFYEIKANYQRQTGEDNPGSVSETYLVEGITPSDVEKRLLDEIKPLIFGNFEVPGIRKRNFFDIYPAESEADHWYEGKVEMITVEENGAEKRRAVNILVQADTVEDAVSSLKKNLGNYDSEIIGVKKSAIIDILRATED
ncbi:MAG: DUF4494 family protein [Paludibacteraceae bacterium]|nr:DUF4494 family protein [Paludibacteraceae bacterium]